MKCPLWWPLTRTSWKRFSPLQIDVSMVKAECFPNLCCTLKCPRHFSYTFPLFQLKWPENHISEQILSPLPLLVWNRGISEQIKWQDTKNSEKMNCRYFSHAFFQAHCGHVLWQPHINYPHISKQNILHHNTHHQPIQRDMEHGMCLGWCERC